MCASSVCLCLTSLDYVRMPDAMLIHMYFRVLQEVLCKKHLAQKRRERLAEMRDLNLLWKGGEITSSDGKVLSGEEGPGGEGDCAGEEGPGGEGDCAGEEGPGGEGDCAGEEAPMGEGAGDGCSAQNLEGYQLESVLRKRRAEESIDLSANKEDILQGGVPVEGNVDNIEEQVLLERPDTPEVTRGEVTSDAGGGDTPYGFEAFDKPSSFQVSPPPFAPPSSGDFSSHTEDLLLPPAAGDNDSGVHIGLEPSPERSGTAGHESTTTTTEADSESASSDMSRDGRAYSTGDVTHYSSRLKDGVQPSHFFGSDMLYLSSPNKQNPSSRATTAADSAIPTQQEFGKYPLLTSLLGGPSSVNSQSAPTDVSHAFMTSADMSYFPLRDLTRLTPTMTALPSSLSTVVGGRGGGGDSVHRGSAAALKAKGKTVGISAQSKPSVTSMQRPAAISAAVERKSRSATMPSSSSSVWGVGGLNGGSNVKRKGTPMNMMGSALPASTSQVKPLSDNRSASDAQPDVANIFQPPKGTSLHTAITAQIEAKKGSAPTTEHLNDTDKRLEEAARTLAAECSSTTTSAGTGPSKNVAPVPPKAKLQIPSGADIARALAERNKPQAMQVAPADAGMEDKAAADIAGLQTPADSHRSLTGVSRLNISDIAKFRDMKKCAKKELKLKKDAAHQQALAASMLALKQQRENGAMKKEPSSKPGKPIVMGPDGVHHGPPKKKRTSKGAKFRMYTRVFLPAFKIEGSITQEKNGGWKYVQFDVGIPLPLPPSLAACVPQSPRMNKGTLDGKWCRACDMEEICSSNGSDTGSGLNSFGDHPYDNTEEDDSGSYGSEDGSLLDCSEVGFRHDHLPDSYDIKFEDDHLHLLEVGGADSVTMRRKRERADSMDASNNVFYSNSMSPSEREVVLALGMNTKLEDSMTGRGVSVAIGSAATMDDVGWHTIELDDDTDDWNL